HRGRGDDRARHGSPTRLHPPRSATRVVRMVRSHAGRDRRGGRLSAGMESAAPDVTRLIDLSHTVESGMVTLEGFPAPLVCDFLSRQESHTRYAPGTEFQIGKI